MFIKPMDWSKVITYQGVQSTANEFLVNNYKDMYLHDMAEFLGISVDAVNRCLRKNNLSKKEGSAINNNAPLKSNKSSYDWNCTVLFDGEEKTRLEVLCENYQKITDKQMSIALGLPEKAIAGKRDRLGLSKKDNHSNVVIEKMPTNKCEAKNGYDWLKEVEYNGKSFSRQSLIQRFHKELTDVQLSKLIGCGLSTVAKKRRKLGLTKPKITRINHVSDYKPSVKANTKGVLYEKYINKIIEYDGQKYKVSDFITKFYSFIKTRQIASITGLGNHVISKFVKDNNLFKGQVKKDDCDSDIIKEIKDKSRVQELYNVGNHIDMICLVTGLKKSEVIELLPYQGEGESRKLLDPNNTLNGGKELTKESTLMLKNYSTNSLVGSYL